MDKTSLREIEILHQISKLTGNHKSNASPLQLLTTLLEKLYLFFGEENRLRFTTLQCFAKQDGGRLQRMQDIPSIFNDRVIPKSNIPARIKEILLFLTASLLAGKDKNEGSANILTLFQDKFIIETVCHEEGEAQGPRVTYNPKHNCLTIHLPHLYKKDIAKKFFPFADAALENLIISQINNNGLLVEGKTVDFLIAKIMSCDGFRAFAGFIHSFLQTPIIKGLTESLSRSVKQINDQFGFNLPVESIHQFCQTIILHSFLKQSKYSYQVIVTKRDQVNAPYYHGTFLFNSNAPFPLDKLNVFHIGLNLSLAAINEAALTDQGKTVEKTTRQSALKRENITYGMVGQGKVMQNIYDKIRKVARFDSDVLVLGESGTGKDMIAQAIHKLSAFKDGPFIPVSLSDRPDSLIDSELFGHEKGAFTGAISQKQGYFERAQGGTLFLDEISHIPVNIQAKLLRVFQSRTFERVGGHTPIHANLRIICATSEDVRNKIIRENLEFLDPLYYRLEQFVITVPPLRYRKEDIPLLVDYYMDKMNNGKKINISQQAIDFLVSLDWPGNIRQLIATLKRAYIEAYDEGEIDRRHFEIEDAVPGAQAKELERNLQTSLDYLRRNNFAIGQALNELNKTAFKISRKTLIRYTRELCLWFLANNDWDLRPAIKSMAGRYDLERQVAIRFRNYFIGDKRSIGILNLLTLNGASSHPHNVIDELVHNTFKGHLAHLKVRVERNEVTKQTWRFILEQYI